MLLHRLMMRVNYLLQLPVSVWFILASRRIHPAYDMGLWRKLRLGARMFANTMVIPTASSYKSHLAMALKILEAAPEHGGVVVECGAWKGGSTANLSLVCEIAGRTLKVFDSFEGLPTGVPGDRQAANYRTGDYHGKLEEVKANVRRHGCIGVCEFIPGWFEHTLPELDDPVLLAYVDVDLEASLDTCVRRLWPNLVDSGFIFIDEYLVLDYCALFWSERWWRENFDRTPPGLIGAGVGLALGEYFIGPWNELDDHPTQHPNGAAYTRKSFSGHWAFYPGPNVVPDRSGA